jgi:hypothetical protein
MIIDGNVLFGLDHTKYIKMSSTQIMSKRKKQECNSKKNNVDERKYINIYNSP